MDWLSWETLLLLELIVANESVEMLYFNKTPHLKNKKTKNPSEHNVISSRLSNSDLP